MGNYIEFAKPKYLIDSKGRKRSIVFDIKEYEIILGMIEDLEDANDLLRAELEATEFTPYEKFRKSWLNI